MRHPFYRTLLFFLCLSLVLVSPIRAQFSLDKYHSPEEVNSLLKSWNSRYPELTKLISIGKSAGDRPLYVLRVAGSSENLPPESRPAVFVSANLEGVHLIGTEAALNLAHKLITRSSSDKKIGQILKKRTVYIAPLLNPDAAQNYFEKVRYGRRVNARPVDEDRDDQKDEDGPDDLNKDGWITQMRVKDPEGKWIPDYQEPRLMRQANPQKGENGIYKIYSEGLDNDKDGKFNEDFPGGVKLNLNFPHDFEYSRKKTGLWPVSEKETIALLDFLTDRRNIAMVLNFSTENTILNLKQTGKPRLAGDKVEVPDRYAEFLGLEKGKKYDIDELIHILEGMDVFGGREIDESFIAMMLGLGPAMTLDRKDRAYIESVQKDYKDSLKKAEIDYPVNKAQGVKKGSFAAYCYFQYGVPVFSTDLWSIPLPEKKSKKEGLTLNQLKSMSSEEFLALGEEKIGAFLKEIGAPERFNASMVMKMVESGRVSPSQMADMMEKMPQKSGGDEEEHPDLYKLKWSDSQLNGKGFVEWTSFQHPTLGDVEVGGFVPYMKTNPPPSQMKKTITFHTDFYLDLMGRLPDLNIHKSEVKTLDENMYRVKLYLSNTGWFPTSTAQGRRARIAWPIRVEVETSGNQKIFSGEKIANIPYIGGSGNVRKLEWTIRGNKGSKIKIKAWAPKLGSVSTSIVLK